MTIITDHSIFCALWRSYDSALVVQGQLCALDVGPSSILHQDLIMDGLQEVRTVLETDFGQGIIDVNYFASLPVSPSKRLFLC